MREVPVSTCCMVCRLSGLRLELARLSSEQHSGEQHSGEQRSIPCRTMPGRVLEVSHHRMTSTPREVTRADPRVFSTQGHRPAEPSPSDMPSGLGQKLWHPGNIAFVGRQVRYYRVISLLSADITRFPLAMKLLSTVAVRYLLVMLVLFFDGLRVHRVILVTFLMVIRSFSWPTWCWTSGPSTVAASDWLTCGPGLYRPVL